MFDYYRSIIRATHRLKDSDRLSEADKRASREIGKRTENSLAEMLHKYRIPQLEIDLNNKQFGSRKIGVPFTSSGDHFEEGALKTTYTILLRETGAGADLNKNGEIDTREEANQMPGETLREIEDLWRKATSNNCGWIGDINQFNDQHCMLGSEPQLNNTFK
ncbi:hypothetical protein K9N68_05795 [Kovacikia minuta CCNUW1]|uniref:hypothetical protein n=1 Tax=Kovacikia minuta TaxID=2931930 RepID=UPI001CD029C0|nr:hypothetical protein [Kovacikia minuta]UBF27458.1 hypothetical protein K9N68_05795 [Kovacikia minuta CCNUW1]